MEALAESFTPAAAQAGAPEALAPHHAHRSDPLFDPPPRRIALFRGLHLGDLLLTTPALRAIRARFPAAEITQIALPWARAFVRHLPHLLDRYVEFEGYGDLGEVPFDAERSRRFVAAQRAYGYDLVVPMHRNGRAANPFALALGPRLAIGYHDGAQPLGFARGAPYPNDLPEVLRHLRLATELLDCEPHGVHLEFPLLPEDRAEAASLLPDLDGVRGRNRERLWVAIHPGARAPSHWWPAERFAAAADALARRYDASIVLLGGVGERELTARVAAAMVAPVADLAGRTTLGGLAAVIAGVDLFISNDSGPAHLANALDTPSVTIFGPAEARRWAPLDQTRHAVLIHRVACSPCNHWTCPLAEHPCLRGIAVAEVLDAAERVLRVGRAAA